MAKTTKASKTATAAKSPKTTEPSKTRRPRAAASPPPAPAEPAGPAIATLVWQRRCGYALVALSAAGMVGTGVLFGTEPLASGLHWAGRAAVQGVCAALVALFLWPLASRWRNVSYVLVLGICGVGLFAYDAVLAWRVDRARAVAHQTLADLEAGRRNVESLTGVEKANAYIEAYVVMRDVYWELGMRANEGLSRYRSRYENYTAAGAFLDTNRLKATADLRHSILQIRDLQWRLSSIESAVPDVSDLLLTVDLLEVDAVTRAAYAEDLHRARDMLVAATAATVVREREILRAMQHSLEVLLEAEGRYRIDDGQIIFESPDDAARFTGKADTG